MTYQAQCRSNEEDTSRWRPIANRKPSEWEDQTDLADLEARLKKRAARYTSWRYRIVSLPDKTAVLQQGQDGTWPDTAEFTQVLVGALVGRRGQPGRRFRHG